MPVLDVPLDAASVLPDGHGVSHLVHSGSHQSDTVVRGCARHVHACMHVHVSVYV